jgi:hypothetical protein
VTAAFRAVLWIAKLGLSVIVFVVTFVLTAVAILLSGKPVPTPKRRATRRRR